MKTKLPYLIASAILVAAIFSYGYDYSKTASEIQSVDNYEYDPAVGETILRTSSSGDTVVFFGSYTCSHCANFYSGTFQRILKEVDATIIYRHAWPTSKTARSASLLTVCSPIDRQPKIIDTLYRRQDELVAAESMDDLYALAGISQKQVKGIIECAEAIDPDMSRDQGRDRDRFNIKGTPTLAVNGKVWTGNHPFEAYGFHE